MELVKDFQITDIIISEDFKSNPPSGRKMERAEQRYLQTGELPGNIIINDSNVLIDGYITYLLAVRYEVKRIDVHRGFIEVIEAVHCPGSAKIYMWRVPPYLIGKLQRGDKCLVRTKQGVKRVNVERILRQQYSVQSPRVRFVIKQIQKGGV